VDQLLLDKAYILTGPGFRKGAICGYFASMFPILFSHSIFIAYSVSPLSLLVYAAAFVPTLFLFEYGEYGSRRARLLMGTTSKRKMHSYIHSMVWYGRHF